MKNGNASLRTPGHAQADAPAARGLSRIETVLGLLGAMVIGGTLAAVRVWAWITRTPFYKE